MTTLDTNTPTANTPETQAPEAVDSQEQDVAQADGNAPEQDADNEAPAEDTDSELKTVKKALDKRNRYINNQRNRIRALEAEMAKMRESFGKNRPAAPTVDKFESVIDYMDAKTNHNLDQKLAEQAHQAKLAALEQQQNMVIEQRTQEVATQVQELLTSNADFAKTVKAGADIINAMPEHVERLMMEIDNAPAATYALVKEGRLQDLYYMPPEIAAAHLVQAEIRGQQYLQQSAPKTPVQQAPKPIGSLKGSGRSSKSYSDMSPDELAKRFLK